jgi:hypothetical protein
VVIRGICDYADSPGIKSGKGIWQLSNTSYISIILVVTSAALYDLYVCGKQRTSELGHSTILPVKYYLQLAQAPPTQH